MTVSEYMALHYTTKVYEDQDGRNVYYVAVHTELPGCVADGATPMEAVNNLRDAKEAYIASMLEDGTPVPMPQISQVMPIRSPQRVPNVLSSSPVYDLGGQPALKLVAA